MNEILTLIIVGFIFGLILPYFVITIGSMLLLKLNGYNTKELSWWNLK